MKKILKGILLLGVGALFVTSCKDEVQVPSEKAFIGSESCKTCHEEKYNDWAASGHPYKFSVIKNGEAPTYPAEVINFQDTWMANLGDGSQSWDDIAGVIGGYGWKSRFVGKDGYVVGTAGSSYSTGVGHNQFNFYGGVDHGWVDYEVGNEAKIYNYGCFKCHTTGPTQDGTWLEGVADLGNFAEPGIGCESCHGPGNIHVVTESAEDIDLIYEFAHTDNTSGGLTVYGVTQFPDVAGNDVNFLCGTCHNRGYDNSIDSKGGFIKHHEQWDEMMSGVHVKADVKCTTCHDPHKRTIWDGDGIIKKCTECHSGPASKINHPGSLSCKDCHMPYAAKSGTTVGDSGFEGDIRSHLMKIIVKDENMYNEDGAAIRDDADRPAALSVAAACLGCHNRDANDNISEKTLEQALASAKDMHD